MIENENLVTEEVVTENTEQTVEQTAPKMYTEDEFMAEVDKKVNEIMPKKIARKEAKIRREYERNNAKYEDLVNTLKAGTGKQSVEELNDTFRDFYTKKGIQIQRKPSNEYSERDTEILANAEADEIIRLGDEEVSEEFERLESIGTNMTAREQAVFRRLAEHLHGSEMGRELAKIGVTREEYNSQEFKDFAAKFDRNTPITEVYDFYQKMKPKKEIRTAGSMKQSQDNGIKDYYSPEEIDRLTEEDLNDPKVWEAVRRSMTGG